MGIIVKAETRRAELRHIGRRQDSIAGGKGVALALGLLYVLLGLSVAAIALGGVAVATIVATDPLWLSVPLGVGAPLLADQLRRRSLPALDGILHVVAGTRVVPGFWEPPQ